MCVWQCINRIFKIKRQEKMERLYNGRGSFIFCACFWFFCSGVIERAFKSTLDLMFINNVCSMTLESYWGPISYWNSVLNCKWIRKIFLWKCRNLSILNPIHIMLIMYWSSEWCLNILYIFWSQAHNVHPPKKVKY